MTQVQRAEINRQNAAHSTGPKTEEGKAKSAQNALTHGLSSAQIPLQNPRFLELLEAFQREHQNPQSQTAQIWLQELAFIAFKLEQIPSIEQQIMVEYSLTLAEHFMQDKPTPLVKLWNLHLRLLGRFNSLVNKLRSHSAANAPLADHPTTPTTPVQNKPKVPSAPPPTVKTPPANTILQNKPTPSPSTLQPPASILQNKPTTSRQKLACAIHSLPQFNL